MSLVADQVRRIDGQLDRLQLASGVRATSTTRANRLQSLVKALSAGTAQIPERPSKLRALVEQFQDYLHEAGGKNGGAGRYGVRFDGVPAATHGGATDGALEADAETDDFVAASTQEYEQELEWLVISKATTQTYGLILEVCLGQMISLDDDMWYWNGVLSSYRWSSYYTLQTSPLRLWSWSTEVYHEAREKVRNLSAEVRTADVSLSRKWQQFYGLVKQTIRDRGVADIQSRVMSPVTRCRADAESNQKMLGKLRELGASGLGVLIDEALRFETDDASSSEGSNKNGQSADEWRSIVSKTVILMESTLQFVTEVDETVTEFEDTVFARLEAASRDDFDHAAATRIPELAQMLHYILTTRLPNHEERIRALRRKHGRPSRLIRYWFPASLLFLSSSTLLRLFFSHRASVIEWAKSAVDTAQDFWFNWVVEPTKKVIGTIRHDEGSEIAIMSKRSLEGDRASLERMVTDFALDHPENGSLTEAQTADIRAKVREGDLTPVLKAYERDLQRPIMGTLRGDLIRALLIQIQKTKVDVEVAMGGIDALLKSQELVFGFIGLGPGIAVCVGLYQWLFRSGQSRSVSKSQLRMVRVLANIDDILTSYIPGSNGMLSYKEHGLLLCEIHVLRENGLRVFPPELHYDYLKHLNKLTEIRTGVEQQAKVARRIQRMWEQVVMRRVSGG